MTASAIRKDIVDYIETTQWVILATVRRDSAPVLRAMGTFAQDEEGRAIYFSTGKGTQKTKQIADNGAVSLFFQHEGQELGSFRNVAVIGNASLVAGSPGLERAVAVLSRRNPRFKDRIDKGELPGLGIYKVEVREIKALDFSKGFGDEAVEDIRL